MSAGLKVVIMSKYQVVSSAMVLSFTGMYLLVLYAIVV
jgi:hypothetical protein